MRDVETQHFKQFEGEACKGLERKDSPYDLCTMRSSARSRQKTQSTHIVALVKARSPDAPKLPGFANPTGVALIIILTLMVVCSMSFVRRSGYFQVNTHF